MKRYFLLLLTLAAAGLTGCSGGDTAGGGAGSPASPTPSSPSNPTPAQAPVIQSFTAGPSGIAAGASTTLRWSVSGADSVSIAPSVAIGSGNSVTVAPSVSTTYTLTARNAQGVATRTARVFVHAPGPVPHPHHAALDMETLPDYGTPRFTYELPELPNTTRSVTITTSGTQAARDLVAACALGNVAINVPDNAGDIGHVGFAGLRDCDITLGPNVRIQQLVICRRPNPGSYCFEPNPPPLYASQRIRVRGGQIGGVTLVHSAEDIVFDGVVINNGVMPSSGRGQTAVGINGANRVAIVNSLIRMVPVDMGGGIEDGTGFMASHARNVIVANNSMVTAGNRNSWGFRLSGGANWIIMDNTVRVSFHKLVRFNDADVDYVYIKGGVWMRAGDVNSTPVDTFANIGTGTFTDRIYIHDTTVYVSPAGGSVVFGAHGGGGGNTNGLWEARNIQWHARNSGVVSDAILADRASQCTAGETCDYGLGTHTYTYNPALVLPTDAWRSIPGFADPNPDNLPVVP